MAEALEVEYHDGALTRLWQRRHRADTLRPTMVGFRALGFLFGAAVDPFLTAVIGVTSGAIGSWVTWLLGRTKMRAEVAKLRGDAEKSLAEAGKLRAEADVIRHELATAQKSVVAARTDVLQAVEDATGLVAEVVDQTADREHVNALRNVSRELQAGRATVPLSRAERRLSATGGPSVKDLEERHLLKRRGNAIEITALGRQVLAVNERGTR